jgi:hypothetical protein
MESGYLRRDDVLKVLEGLDVVPDPKNTNKFRLLGKGIYVEIVPPSGLSPGSIAARILGDAQNALNPEIKKILVEGYDNLLDYRVNGGRDYVKAYLDSMGLEVEGPRKNPHIKVSISGDFDSQTLGEEIDRQAGKILLAQYNISKFPHIAASAFDLAARQHFGLQEKNNLLYFSD